MLGFKIIELRKIKGISQKKLAELMNVTPQAVSLWEKEKTYPDIFNLIRLADILDVTLDELVGREQKSELEVKHDNEITKLINKYRRMTEGQKIQLIGYIDGLLGGDENIIIN